VFNEFCDDHGTGRLIISVVYWLTRMEERLDSSKLKRIPLLKTVPNFLVSYDVQGEFIG
jgi:hypothetical protein